MYLVPEPRKIIFTKGTCLLTYDLEITVDANYKEVLYDCSILLKEMLKKQLGVSFPIVVGQKGKIFLTIDENAKEQSYNLTITEEGIIISGDSIGVMYGIQTLRQIVLQQGATLDCLSIADHPSVLHRGYYYDVTRGRVPTVEFLKELVDQLSFYKMNQLQLYIEHTYLFPDFSEVWRDDTPLCAEDILELEAYCKKRNIELVPSLSTFGHLYKLLETKEYGHLSELEDDNKRDFSFDDRMRRHILDVTNEGSLPLAKKMIEEYMALFSSKYFNICADETFDLGKGRSKALVEELGMDKVYLGFVKQLLEFVVSKGKIPMFWGDIIAGFPNALKELPKETICLNWGYDPNQKEDDTKNIAAAGALQYVCPGVAGWNQLINLIDSSYQNISKMCNYGRKYSALGVLNTDWGDFGHINDPRFSLTGMIYGAALSWQESNTSQEELNKAISKLAYLDHSETFVDTVSAIANLQTVTWRQIVVFKEFLEQGRKDAVEKSVPNHDVLKIQEDNNKLDREVEKLYGIIKNMDTRTTSLAYEYLLAAKGISIWNEIGVCTTNYYYDNKKVEGQALRLAKALETWYHGFKQQWRSIGQEGELYRLTELVIWYADYLRDIEFTS